MGIGNEPFESDEFNPFFSFFRTRSNNYTCKKKEIKDFTIFRFVGSIIGALVFIKFFKTFNCNDDVRGLLNPEDCTFLSLFLLFEKELASILLKGLILS